MHPTDHQGRRRARAQSISKTYQNRKNAVYVDAATYMNGKDAVVTMIDAQLKEKVSASLKNCTVSDAEEAAVALAVAEGNRSGQSLVIITDSQDACRGYTNASGADRQAELLKKKERRNHSAEQPKVGAGEGRQRKPPQVSMAQPQPEPGAAATVDEYLQWVHNRMANHVCSLDATQLLRAVRLVDGIARTEEDFQGYARLVQYQGFDPVKTIKKMLERKSAKTVSA
ncbi:hypothetical protein MTO96_031821 [Rhipicephalus appendiculatus]